MARTLKLLLLALLFPGLAQAASLKDAEKALAQTDSFQANFTQRTYNALREKTLTHQGQVSWARPGLMRWQYQGDEPLLIVVGKSKIYMVDPLLENVTVSDKSEVKRLKLLSFLFAGDALSQAYRAGAKPTMTLAPGAWLHLAPKKPDPNLISLHLLFKKAGLQRFVIVGPHGNWREFEFTKYQANPKLPAQLFEYQIPPNMEVIDKLSKGR